MSVPVVQSIPVTGPGIFRMSADEYHADPMPAPSLSASLAKVLIAATPRHAFVQHPRLNPSFEVEDDKKFDVGTAAHALMLGHGRDIQVIDAKDYRGGAAKQARDEALAAGLTPLLTDQLTLVETMCDAIREQLDAAGMPEVFTEGEGMPEAVLAWQDPYAGWCRSQLDWLRADMLVIDDLKITGRSVVSNDGLAYHVADMGYEVQAAFYERGLSILRPDLAGRIRFRFHFAEDKPPHALRSVELDAAALAIGRKKVSVAMGIWRRCVDSGDWPLFPPGVARIAYPPRAENAWMEREQSSDDIGDLLNADPYLGRVVDAPRAAGTSSSNLTMAG